MPLSWMGTGTSAHGLSDNRARVSALTKLSRSVRPGANPATPKGAGPLSAFSNNPRLLPQVKQLPRLHPISFSNPIAPH